MLITQTNRILCSDLGDGEVLCPVWGSPIWAGGVGGYRGGIVHGQTFTHNGLCWLLNTEQNRRRHKIFAQMSSWWRYGPHKTLKSGQLRTECTSPLCDSCESHRCSCSESVVCTCVWDRPPLPGNWSPLASLSHSVLQSAVWLSAMRNKTPFGTANVKR